MALSIDEARALVLGAVTPLQPRSVAVGEALGLVLARDVHAASDVPRFDNSAMDGFALQAGAAGRRLEITGESRAGSPFTGALGPGQAARISTGAPLPEGAQAVLQLELAADEGDSVVTGADVAPGRNVRRAGEDMRAGERVLAAGARLGAAEIGAAIVAGCAEVSCAPRPVVAVVTTGDELVAPGEPLGPGAIHDSNGSTLAALATASGATVLTPLHAPDDRTATERVLGGALARADVLVVAGGVSVGRHDHVKPALVALGVEEVFWQVALRPGRPTWFGTHGAKLVLGLPGNPVSAYVTFVLFARPALAALQGAGPPPPRRRARLGAPLPRHPDRDECVRVALDADGLALPTGPQGSHVLSSLLGADALALVPRGDGDLGAGEQVELEPLT